jgi:hypothetical protein
MQPYGHKLLEHQRSNGMRIVQVLLIAVNVACANREWTIGTPDRGALEAAYRTQDEAIKRSDAKAFMATIGANYTVHLRNGVTLTREQVESAIAADMRRTVGVERATSRITELILQGDTAQVVVTHETVRTVSDATGTPRRWESGVVHRETWIRTSGGWRINRLEELQQLYLRRDGVSLNN